MHTVIPPEHDPDIILWKAEGVPLRDIALRLRERGVKASHTAVARRLQAIVRATAPVTLAQEALLTLSLNLPDLEEVENRLRQLEEVAFKGSARHGIPPSYALAYRAVTRRGELILSKHRLLQTAVQEERSSAPKPVL